MCRVFRDCISFVVKGYVPVERRALRATRGQSAGQSESFKGLIAYQSSGESSSRTVLCKERISDFLSFSAEVEFKVYNDGVGRESKFEVIIRCVSETICGKG